jgi:hypothetical protein
MCNFSAHLSPSIKGLQLVMFYFLTSYDFFVISINIFQKSKKLYIKSTFLINDKKIKS